METIKTTTSRIHPLMAAAAVSVIVVSLAGTAAITGILPSSHGAPQAAAMDTAQTAPAYGNSAQPYDAAVPASAQAGYAQPMAAQMPLAQTAAPAPAPVVIKETVIKEVPVKTASHPVQHHHTSYAHDDGYYAPAARPAPQQPNYVAIGTGAVIGGLVGNQIGSGNGRKLATVAGLIGGGYLGNQMANQNR
jgi:uncharacterized protein YcfJ